MNKAHQNPEKEQKLGPQQEQATPPSEEEAVAATFTNNAEIDGDNFAETKNEKDKITTLTLQLEQAEQEIVTLKEDVLRACAEVENVRRRAENEVIGARKYGIENFAKALLDVSDSLDQATQIELNSSADDSMVEQTREGLALTLKQFQSVMERFSIRQIKPATGEKFDPNFHQAISTQPSDEIESNCIVSVVQTGFILHDRLLRPVMVVVAKKQ